MVYRHRPLRDLLRFLGLVLDPFRPDTLAVLDFGTPPMI